MDHLLYDPSPPQMPPDLTRLKAPEFPEGEQLNPIAESQEMAAEMSLQPTTSGYAPAFSNGSGAAWVFRDLASI
jgi:hypothetical protein